jgi:hypothetical protein
LFPCSCALQGVLPKIPPAASFPQGSEVDREVLHAIMAPGGRHKPASWALWGIMPDSKRASAIPL